jgi:putative transposase
METWVSRPVPARTLTKLIDPNHSGLSIAHQAQLLGVARQSYYYQPVVNEAETARLKLHLDAIDEIYTDYPFYGSRRMQVELEQEYGITIGRKRIRNLMQHLGLEAIYPKPNTSKPAPGHEIYPYLLRGIEAQYPNHIWGTDITYIRTHEGFVYLVAFMDWYSRYVVSWQLADSLENSFVLQALQGALNFMADCGLGIPDICNSDQGSHFTSEAYISLLEQAGVRISMDGRGRCLDNIFTERLWRSVKYENVFIQSYQNIHEAQAGLTDYFQFYNHKRKHQALDYRTPATVYFELRTDQ